jgi:hypothetical protein
MTLHVGIAFRFGFSPKDYFRMKLHANIEFRVGSSPKDYFRMNLHSSIAFRPLKAPKLHFGCFESTLHVSIAFKVRVFS